MKNAKVMLLALMGMTQTVTMSSLAMRGPSSGRYNRILQKIKQTSAGASVAPQPGQPAPEEKKVVPQDDVPEGTCVLCEAEQAQSSFGCGLRLHHACKSCFEQCKAKNMGCPFCVK